MDKREYSYAVVGNVNWCSHCWKQNSNHWKFKIELPKDPEILLLGIYPKKTKTLIQKDICTPMFTAALIIISKIQKKPKCPINRWVDKKVWKILFSHKATKRKMCHLQQLGRPRGYHAQWNKSEKIQQILYHPTYNRNLKKQTNKIMSQQQKQSHRYKEQTGGC